MDGVRIAELRWLASQKEPVWGGPIERGMDRNPSCDGLVNAGLIKKVAVPDQFGLILHGYVITDKGRALIADADRGSNRCPTCGQPLPRAAAKEG